MSLQNNRKYIKNHNGTYSFYIWRIQRNCRFNYYYSNVTKNWFSFFVKYWYSSLDYYLNRIPFNYLAKMKLFDFKNYTFKDSIEINSRIKKYSNDYKYIIRLKNELKGHEEILKLVYRGRRK